MKIIKPSVEPLFFPDQETLYRLIEIAGRTCYQSERTTGRTCYQSKEMGGDTPEKFIQRIMKRKHWSVLEHASLSVRIVCDRGVTHELVRHRIASYSQESTRYCNYSGDKFGGEIKVIDLATGFKYDLDNPQDQAKYGEWMAAMGDAERHYMKMLELGATPQEARSILPNSTKTQIVVTMNIREWRHFLEMRWVGVAGTPHPQMVEVAEKVHILLNLYYPALFGDIKKPR